ncbi:electron carrier [Basidiobolus ranarum]|uniref:Electron carrier n=1 Tax=Basidiobolus ranarum TaxID=34480 RepID=A0ABR2VW91_9FUNG
MFEVTAGDRVLLVGNPQVNLDALKQCRTELDSKVTTSGKVDFEQFDRIPILYLTPIYNAILTGVLQPSGVSHTSAILGKLLGALLPGGRLFLHEPVLIDENDKKAGIPINRTAKDIVSELKINGFIDVEVNSRILAEEELNEYIQNTWNITDKDSAHQYLQGKLEMLQVVAKKPAYEVGAVASLPFARKKAAAKATKRAAVWKISANDEEDEELEDEDDLLDEDDLAKPDPNSLAKPDDCSTKKKACKNCSCGLSEEVEVKEKKKRAPAPTPAPVSSCGSCYLGDAFRCGSCPYMGMPAFKPGEKVQLGGSMMADDIDI